MNCIGNILKYNSNLSEKEFYKNQLIKDATVRNYEIIGEAAKKVSLRFRSKYPEVEWKKMAGMRDKLIHDYIEVDYEIVWFTTKEIIPALEKLISNILEKEEKNI